MLEVGDGQFSPSTKNHPFRRKGLVTKRHRTRHRIVLIIYLLNTIFPVESKKFINFQPWNKPQVSNKKMVFHFFRVVLDTYNRNSSEDIQHFWLLLFWMHSQRTSQLPTDWTGNVWSLSGSDGWWYAGLSNALRGRISQWWWVFCWCACSMGPMFLG